MSDELVAVVIGGAFTLVGGFGGAWLTAWRDRHRADVAHARERRAVQREHAIEIADAGWDWTSSTLSVTFALVSDMAVNDLLDLDAWKSHLTTSARYRRALRATDLIFNDVTVRAAAAKLIEHSDNQTKVMEPVSVKKLRGGRAARDEAQAVLDFLDEHKALLDEFVAAAAKLVD